MQELLSNIGMFFTVTTGAILIENAILSRGLGTDRLLLVNEDIHSTLDFATVLTIITTIGCGLSFFVDRLLVSFVYNYSMKPFIYICVMGAIYVAVHEITKKKMKNFKKLQEHITVGVFNCAVLGSMLLVSVKELSFINAIGFGLGTGLGYTLAIVLISEGNRKMKNKDMPIAFKGLPSMLVYIGILSMAVFALTGYQL